MGLRFRRRLGIVPGISLNLSKSGVSASIGTRGAVVNVSGRGTRATIGLPGSGVSWSTARRPWGAPHRRGAGGGAIIAAVVILALMLGAMIVEL